jgi:hypothetical protein
MGSRGARERSDEVRAGAVKSLINWQAGGHLDERPSHVVHSLWRIEGFGSVAVCGFLRNKMMTQERVHHRMRKSSCWVAGAIIALNVLL